MVQEDVVLTDGGEDVLGLAGFHLGDLPVGRRDEGLELQVGPVDGLELEEDRPIKGCRQTVYLVRVDPKLGGQELGEEGGSGVRDLQAYRGAETALEQFLLHCVQEVLGIVLLHVDVLVTGDAEGTGLLDDHAGEQRLQVGDDQVLHGDETIALVATLLVGQIVDGDQAGEVVRNLDPGEVGLARGRVLDQDGQVQGVARDVGEGVGRVHRQRSQDREDLVAEEA